MGYQKRYVILLVDEDDDSDLETRLELSLDQLVGKGIVAYDKNSYPQEVSDDDAQEEFPQAFPKKEV